MRSYAERELFEPGEIADWQTATKLVTLVPYAIDGEPVRCHELARAVACHLGLYVCDGKYGMVEHSWIVTRTMKLSNILDVYVPGSMPQVQLISSCRLLPTAYNPRHARGDIRVGVMRFLEGILNRGNVIGGAKD